MNNQFQLDLKFQTGLIFHYLCLCLFHIIFNLSFSTTLDMQNVEFYGTLVTIKWKFCNFLL